MLRPLARALGLLALCGAGLFGAARADEASDIAALYAAGQHGVALTQLDKRIDERPRDPQLRFLKGVLLSNEARPDDAAAVFEQLTVDYPDMPEPYNNLAVIRAARGEYGEARALLEAALRAQPGYAVAQQNLGDVYVQLARLAYLEAQKLEPNNPALAPKLTALRQAVQPLPAAGAASAPATTTRTSP
jgi:Flp pilus assembly protein TadD